MSCDPLEDLAGHIIAHAALGVSAGGSVVAWTVYTDSPDTRPAQTADNAYIPYIVRNASSHARAEIILQRADNSYAYWPFITQF